MLKRGISATIQELLLSAEYLLAEGNYDVILCERGVRSFDTATRNLVRPDGDPGGAQNCRTFRSSPIRRTATGPARQGDSDGGAPRSPPGADGIMVEVHPNPEEALSDGAQSALSRSVRAADARGSDNCGSNWATGGGSRQR